VPQGSDAATESHGRTRLTTGTRFWQLPRPTERMGDDMLGTQAVSAPFVAGKRENKETLPWGERGEVSGLAMLSALMPP
jgi:hypothetical protein